MLGIVLVTQGNIGFEFIKVLESIFGKQNQISFASIEISNNIDVGRKSALNAINEVNSGDGVVVFTDMFGGIANNIALFFKDMQQVRIVTGLNLTMLIRFTAIRENLPLDIAINESLNMAKRYLGYCEEIFQKENKENKEG